MSIGVCNRLACVLGIVNQDSSRFIVLDESGLNCTKEKERETKVADVAAYVLKQLDDVIQNKELKGKFSKKLYKNITSYFDKRSDDEPLCALIRSALFAASMRIKQKGSAFIETIGQCSVAFSEVDVDPENRYLVLDEKNGLSVTKDKEHASTPEQVATYLKGILHTFINQKELSIRLPSHNGIYALQRSAIPYFERNFPKDSMLRHELCSFYLPMAEEKWIFFRGQAKKKELDRAADKEYEAWIIDPPKNPKKTEMDVLVYARDILFFQQTMHHFARRHAVLQLAISERIVHQSSQNIEVIFAGNTFTYNQEECPVHKAVMKACKYIAKEGVTSRIESALKLLVDYKKDPNHIPEHYERLVHFLELNELYYQSVLLEEEEWDKVSYSCKKIVNNVIKEFRTRGYLPCKQLEFLIYSHIAFKDNFLPAVTACSVKEQAASIKVKATEYLEVLDSLSIEPNRTFFQAVDKALHTMLAKMPKSRPFDVTTRYFASDKDNDDDGYLWTKISYDTYMSLLQSIEELSRGVCLSLPSELIRIEQKKPTANRGFDVAIPERKVVVQKKKRKKPPTPTSSPSPPPTLEGSRSASPETISPLPKPKPQREREPKATRRVESLTKAIANLTLFPEPEIPIVQSGLKYDKRVTRWRLDVTHPDHPFNSDPAYQNVGNKDWVILEHIVARYIDQFYKYAVADRPKKEYDFAERRQLVVSITKMGPIEETRMGVLIWAKGNRDGLVYHRWFEPEEAGKTEHFDESYVQESYKMLKARPLPPPFMGKPKEKALDGSFLELQDERFIVISDPQNNVRVRLILPSSSI